MRLHGSASDRVNVDLEEGATVSDLLKVVADLKGVPLEGLYIVGEKYGSQVKLNKNEVPSGVISLGGVDNLDDIPEVLSVDVVKPRESLTLEEACKLLDELIVVYTSDKFMKQMEAFRKKYIDAGVDDPKQYRKGLAVWGAPYIKDLERKWNFSGGATMTA